MSAAHKSEVIVLAADHNGVGLKQQVKEFLQSRGHRCIDLGPHTDAAKVDYTDYASALAHVVDSREADRGILICGTGVGMSIVANRFPHVRASLVHSVDVARKTREHNDSNVLCLGAWVVSPGENLAIVRAWMDEKFGEGRHVPRVEKTDTSHKRHTVVFTNGIFDIMHVGHLRLLRFARSLGSKLVVGINSDRATKVLKGPERPVHNEAHRKEFLEALRYVDEVIIFDDVKTASLLSQINPDIVVKGGEWSAEEVRERDQIPAHIEIKTYPLVFNPEKPDAKYSTTGVIEKIRTERKAELA